MKQYVYCINADYSSDFTVGKVYELADPRSYHIVYVVEDNAGEHNGMSAKHFIHLGFNAIPTKLECAIYDIAENCKESSTVTK